MDKCAAFAQRIGEERESLVAASFDAGSGDATIHDVRRLAHQQPCIQIAGVSLQGKSKRPHCFEDSAQMISFLFGQSGEPHHDFGRVAERLDETERRGGSLFFTMSVIRQQCLNVCERDVGPAARGWR